MGVGDWGCLALVIIYHWSLVTCQSTLDKRQKTITVLLRRNPTTPKALGLGMEPQHKTSLSVQSSPWGQSLEAVGELEAS